MQGQSGILLGKEAGNILPPSLLVLIHSFIQGPLQALNHALRSSQEGSVLWAVESDRSGFESDPLPRTVVKLNYLI